MNFYNQEFLVSHIKSILDFYEKRVVDNSGGFFQNYYDDGQVFDNDLKHLVSSCRITINFARAGEHFNRQDYKNIAAHGLSYIEKVHWLSEQQLYAWTLKNNQPTDLTQQAYGYAFVLLTYAAVRKAEIIDTDEPLIQTYNLLERVFWQEDYGLYADEISSSGELSSYRGQNSNMHMCEAMISAYQVTGKEFFLDRALLIAENIVKRQSAKTFGLVWEHYSEYFEPDWLYNKQDPKNLYRPWGFQPGHQTEWAKLLLSLNRLSPNAWLIEKAIKLFDRSYNAAWDSKFGGLVYALDINNCWCDDDKYFWVQAESIAAAALIYEVTLDELYLQKYEQLWDYCWTHMIDHNFGAWFRVLKRNNVTYSNIKSSAGAKCDYHTIGACFDVLDALT